MSALRRVADLLDQGVDLPTALRLADRGYIELPDGITAPATGSKARIYVDTADGDLKVKFSDGTVTVIAADT